MASLKALGATDNNTSNEEQPLALAARSVAGIEPEDKEALGDSPAETVVRFQSKASKRRAQVLLSVLAAILIIGLVVVVLAVVVRRKDNVDASAGGSVDRRLGLGLFSI